MADVAVEIPSRSAYVGVVRLALASLARASGLPEEAVDDLKIAVGEACANAVISNEEAGSDAPVEIKWHDDESHIVIEVSDRGIGYDRSALGQDDIETGGFAWRLLMSVALLDSIVDQFELERRDGGGTRARLVVSRSAV